MHLSYCKGSNILQFTHAELEAEQTFSYHIYCSLIKFANVNFIIIERKHRYLKLDRLDRCNLRSSRKSSVSQV